MVFSRIYSYARPVMVVLMIACGTSSCAGVASSAVLAKPVVALSFAGVLAAMKHDTRLALSGVFTAGTIGILGYGLYHKLRNSSFFNSQVVRPLPQPVRIDPPLDPLQPLVIRNLELRLLALERNRPCVDSTTNEFFKDKTFKGPVNLTDDARFIQFLVLWQPMTGQGFGNGDLAFDQANAESSGVNYQEIIRQNRQFTLGNGLVFNEYVKGAHLVGSYEGSIAGGATSCGYQVLKNVVCLLNALHAGNDDDQHKRSLDMLLDLPYTIHLFGKENKSLSPVYPLFSRNGVWREKVVETMRKPRLIEWYLDHKLSYNKFLIDETMVEDIVCDYGIRPARILGIYKGIAGRLNKVQTEKDMKEICDHPHDGPRMITRSVDDLFQAIKDYTVYEREDQEERDINEYFKNDDVIKKFIKVDEADELSCVMYTTDDFMKRLESYFNDTCNELLKSKGYAPQPIPLDGENLNNAELQDLIEMERKTGGLLEPFKHVPYSIVQTDSDLQEAINTLLQERARNPEKYCRVIFLHGDGHWVAFIVTKVNDRVDYLVADSLNLPRYGAAYIEARDEALNLNINYSEITTRIWEIISRLENQ